MKHHRYTLEPYKGMKSRYQCPNCNKAKTFTLYIDTETKEYLSESVGKCERLSNCGYHYTPKQYFQDNNISFDKSFVQHKPKFIKPEPKPISFINPDIFKSSLQSLEKNHFVIFLSSLFGSEITSKLISQYFIGTSKHWNGSTVFWQIDTNGKVRTGKIMLYKPNTGKRVKEPFNHISWVHKALKLPDFGLKQCFFGEHLLKDNTKPIAIVESEKTAIIASVYLPEFVWLSVGSLTNLNAEKCEILKGQKIILFPDLNGFDKWKAKAKELSNIANFQVSDLLEHKATESERKQGLDLADYLIRFDYREFVLPEQSVQFKESTNKFELKPVQNENLLSANLSEPIQISSKKSEPVFEFEESPKDNWNNQIADLETFFAQIKLPEKPFQLNQYIVISCVKEFIKSHFNFIKNSKAKKAFLPYLDRLFELKSKLSELTNFPIP